MVRFQRQPPGTAITRTALLAGAGLACVAAWYVGHDEQVAAAIAAGTGAILLLVGGHRANHGEGGPVDRMLTELLDRVWDAAMLGSLIWVSYDDEPAIAIGALVALCASFLSSYVRARGAALGYSVEESHVARGIRYAVVVAGISLGWVAAGVWAAAALSVLAATVRTGQVAREDRA
jgi:hypothetical protein